jgi:nucleoside-diphosphate-sugar epimerase
MIDILVTGANGFLGRSIVGEVSQSNSVITLGTSTKNNIICNLANNVPQFSFNIDLVIHAAGKAHIVPKSSIEADEFYNVNVNGTFNLLKGLSQKPPKCFVFISSVSVYGLSEGLNINENQPLLAIDPYGASKIKAEKIIIDWCRTNNVILTILRLPLLVGVNPPGNLGRLIRGIQKGYFFNISSGKNKKSMVIADDVSAFILHASRIGGIYNLTDGFHPSFKDLSKAIATRYRSKLYLDIPLFVAYFLAKIGDLLGALSPFNSKVLMKMNSELTFDDTLAKQNAGWNPRKVLDFYS